jgi:uncharacterized cupredoxin-like copper-binding protein
MRKLLALAVACTFAAALLACGGSDGDTERTEVGVSLKEWSVSPSQTEARPGTVTFEVRNEGSMPHQLVVIKSDLPPEMLPVANGDIATSQVRILESIDPIGSGATAEVRFEATAGKYVLVCNVPGHYQQGMTTSFLIEP